MQTPFVGPDGDRTEAALCDSGQFGGMSGNTGRDSCTDSIMLTLRIPDFYCRSSAELPIWRTLSCRVPVTRGNQEQRLQACRHARPCQECLCGSFWYCSACCRRSLLRSSRHAMLTSSLRIWIAARAFPVLSFKRWHKMVMDFSGSEPEAVSLVGMAITFGITPSL